MRLPSGTPVSPAMNTPPKNQADDGEAEKRLPRASATFTVVVSGDSAGSGAGRRACGTATASPRVASGRGPLGLRTRTSTGRPVGSRDWPRVGSMSCAPLGRVGVGEEAGRGNLRELRVAVVRVPVGQRELERLGHRVDVLGRVVAHPLEIEALEERERLEQASAPGPRSRS